MIMLFVYRTVRASSFVVYQSLPFISRRSDRRFYSLKKMNRSDDRAVSLRGRGSSPRVQYDGSSQNVSFGVELGDSNNTRQHTKKKTRDGFPTSPKQQNASLDIYEQDVSSCSTNNSSRKQERDSVEASNPNFEPGFLYDDEFPALTSGIFSSISGRHLNKRRTTIDIGQEQKIGHKNSSLLECEKTPVMNLTSQLDKSSLPTTFRKKGKHTQNKKPQSSEIYPNYSAGSKNLNGSESLQNVKPFDICFPRSRTFMGGAVVSTKEMVLRPGMILLKHYVRVSEQIEIVKTCRKLGLGPGGFYQPSYQGGAKLRLHMMCLGLNWDPETRKYEDRWPIDGCEPPGIPQEFCLLVQRAMQDAHALIKKQSGSSKVEDILPSVSPDTCIVNFYTTGGRLGLHQDRDESKESLSKGSPVVSLSIGNSAEFLYGDQRSEDKAEKLILESGDVLIFGGKSHHIFHGVSSIIPKSAPNTLMDAAELRPGRLNLTFRQY